MENTQKNIKPMNNLRDLAHEVVIIFFPEISEGSWVFKNKKEKVIKLLEENKDVFSFIE